MPDGSDQQRVKASLKCPEECKSRLNKSHCLLTISVGQEVHEGSKFSATVQLVNRYFKRCTILVDDVLQRHTMSLDSNEMEADIYNKSIEEGDRWLKRNKFIYAQLSIPYGIIRWEDWLKHERYLKQYEKIQKMYHENDFYREAITDSVNEFLKRYQRRVGSMAFDRKRVEDVCRDYLMEECTALCLWVEGGFHFEVYPSKRNTAMQVTHKYFVEPYYPDLLHPIAIKFKNRAQLKPQAFETMMAENF